MKLELDMVSRHYGSAMALDSVSLSINDGEFFTLVDPSGCGKMTMLHCIVGFESLTERTVHFDGESMVDVASESRGVDVMFRNYALFPHLSVGGNVVCGLRFTDPPDSSSRGDRAARLSDFVGLMGFEDRNPDPLPDGQ